jgi:hypothetical protein
MATVRKCALLLALRAATETRHLRPSAIGNALGSSIADEMGPQPVAGGSGLRLSADAAESWGTQLN